MQSTTLSPENRVKQVRMARAILTDTHFWIPAAVLLLGVALLVALH